MLQRRVHGWPVRPDCQRRRAFVRPRRTTRIVRTPRVHTPIFVQKDLDGCQVTIVCDFHADARSTVSTMRSERGRKAIATNRKARHLYVVLDTVEAGIVLVGNEVKSLRLGRASLVDAFATVDDHEVWMYNLHIAEYAMGGWTNHATRRKR